MLTLTKNLKKTIAMFAVVAITGLMLCTNAFAKPNMPYKDTFSVDGATNSTLLMVIYEGNDKPGLCLVSPSGEEIPLSGTQTTLKETVLTMEEADGSFKINISNGEAGEWECYATCEIVTMAKSTADVSEQVATEGQESTDSILETVSEDDNEKETKASKEGETEDSQSLKTLTKIAGLMPIIMIAIIIIAVVVAAFIVIKHRKNPKPAASNKNPNNARFDKKGRKIPMVGVVHQMVKNGKDVNNSQNSMTEATYQTSKNEKDANNSQNYAAEETERYADAYTAKEELEKQKENITEKNNVQTGDIEQNNVPLENNQAKKSSPFFFGRNSKKQAEDRQAETENTTDFKPVDEKEEWEIIRAKAEEMWAGYEKDIEKAQKKQQNDITSYTNNEQIFYVTQEDLDNDVTIEEYVDETEDAETGQEVSLTKRKSFFPENRFG